MHDMNRNELDSPDEEKWRCASLCVDTCYVTEQSREKKAEED